MSQTFEDESGTTRLRGTLKGLPASGIPQGGPLSADLLTNDFLVKGSGASPASLYVGNGPSASIQGLAGDGQVGVQGGLVSLRGGAGNGGVSAPASLDVQGGQGAGSPGAVAITTFGSPGLPGQVLVPDGNGYLSYGGVQIAAGVPVGAPVGLPFAFDSTAVSGGLYVWNGAAWLKVSVHP